MNGKKALVSGANGFIGSHLVRALLTRGYDVRALVRPTSDIRSIGGLPLTIYLGDVRQPETLVTVMQGVEYVFHLAAVLLTSSREAFVETNTQGTINMLDAAEKYAAGSLKRFLYVSSQAAAGPGQDVTPITESRPLQPVSWYGESKKLSEEAVHARSNRLPVTIIRPVAVYGERERDISQTFPVIKTGLFPKLGLGSDYAVMVYVEDLVEGMILAAESANTLNKPYFLNHPETLTTEQVVRTTAQAMGRTAGVVVPVPLFVLRLVAPVSEFIAQIARDRPATTRDKVRELSHKYWVTSPANAKNDFGWEARHNLLAGMKPTTDYFFAQQQQVREMALDKQPLLWSNFLVCAIALGGLLESTSALGHFYAFQPWWASYFFAIGGFGVVLGTFAMLLRARSALVQMVVGTAIAGLFEALNQLGLLPLVSWQFSPGWPFGITNDWLRVFVLALAGGLFLIIVNGMARQLYKRRLRVG